MGDLGEMDRGQSRRSGVRGPDHKAPGLVLGNGVSKLGSLHFIVKFETRRGLIEMLYSVCSHICGVGGYGPQFLRLLVCLSIKPCLALEGGSWVWHSQWYCST